MERNYLKYKEFYNDKCILDEQLSKFTNVYSLGKTLNYFEPADMVYAFTLAIQRIKIRCYNIDRPYGSS